MLFSFIHIYIFFYNKSNLYNDNFSIISVMQWFEGDIKITIMCAIYFQLNYENDVNIWLLKLFLQK